MEPEQKSPRRGAIRARILAVMGSALMVAGLTVTPATAAPPEGAPARTASLMAAVKPATTTLKSLPSTSLAWGSDSVRIAVAVSRALYDQADGVLLVGAADIAGLDAGQQRQAPGLPVLLAPKNAADRKLVSAELTRLGARWLLPVGSRAQTAAKSVAADVAGVRVATKASQIPAASVALPKTALLVSTSAKKKTRAGLAAARLTGQRLGATVINLRGHDPRADKKVVKKLAKVRPAAVIGIGAKLGPKERFAQRVTTAMTGVQLPGGGQVMFPGRTLVALYGKPGSTVLGALGQQGLNPAISRAAKVAKKYRKWTSGPVVPTFEIIATMASASPGSDGSYSQPTSIDTMEQWVKAATKAGMYVILDLQPGRTNFLDQAKTLEKLLLHPNVGLALDPEWRLGPNQLHLQQIGHVSAEEVNSVIVWLDRLVADHHLPQKALVIHQFTLGMVRHSAKIQTNRDGVSVLIHMDGQGSPAAKESTWAAIVAAAPKGVTFGWKNFYVMDTKTLTPKQTMNHKPQPVMISYQ